MMNRIRTHSTCSAFIGLLAILLAGCATYPSQSQTVLASGGVVPGGWLADGSELLIHVIGRQPYVTAVDDVASSPVNGPWDFSQVVGGGVLWSPDGTSLLYKKPERGTGCVNVSPPCINLYRVDSPGDKATLLISATGVSYPTWSSDGQRFAVVVDSALRLYSREGSHYRELSVGSIPENLSWSPDGKVIAFGDFAGMVQLLDVESGQLLETGGFPREGREPSWSPSGEFIVYAEFLRLVIVKLDGTQYTVIAGAAEPVTPQLRNEGFVYTRPMWSPRGDYIAVGRVDATIPQERQYESYEVILIPVPDDLR